MSNWKESARKSLENRNANTPAPTVKSFAASSAGASSSGGWQAAAKQSLDSRGYVAPQDRSKSVRVSSVSSAPDSSDNGRKMSALENVLYYPALTADAAFDSLESTWDFLNAGTAALAEGVTSGFGLAPNWVSEKFKNEKQHWLSKETLGGKHSSKLKETYYRPEWSKNWVEPTVEAAGALLPSIAAGLTTGVASGTAAGVQKSFNAAVNAADIAALAGTNANRAASAAKLGTRLKKAANIAKLGAKSFFEPSSALFGASAAGRGAKEAYAESGKANRSLVYGIGSGFVEMATEKLFGGIAGTDIGESVIKWGAKNKTLNKIFTNSAVKKGLDIVGEGAEEMISTAIDPFLKMSTLSKLNVDFSL